MKDPDFDSVFLHSSKYIGGEAYTVNGINHRKELLRQSRGEQSKSCVLIRRNKIKTANAKEEEEVLEFTFIVEQAKGPNVIFFSLKLLNQTSTVLRSFCS